MMYLLVVWTLGVAFAQTAQTTWELRVCADQNNMPFSSKNLNGFENRIVALLADDLHARVTYQWIDAAVLRESPQAPRALRRGQCDVLLDVADGQGPYLTTLPYYQSTYVFAYREDPSFDATELSLDAPVLRKVVIGVFASSVPNVALLKRGFRTRGHLKYVLPRSGGSDTPLLDEVASRKIDLAIVWGPIAGYYKIRHRAPIVLAPVTPQVDGSGLAMVYSVSLGVRAGDVELRDLLNGAIADEWNAIQLVLKSYDVPLVPLPKPVAHIGGP